MPGFNSWLAVRVGETLVCHLPHGGPDRREDFAHVFISPQLNGWTVVRGPSCDPDRCSQVARWAGRLSRQYGSAQVYFFGSQGDGDA
jgi:hypothetical protein